MLVENSLVAVVSLPAGVFNPYSGVKTSILILDKSLAQTERYHRLLQGGERRLRPWRTTPRVDKNDLPQAQNEIGKYLRCIRSGESIEDCQPTLGLIVAKEKIAANREYILTGSGIRNMEFVLRTFQPFR